MRGNWTTGVRVGLAIAVLASFALAENPATKEAEGVTCTGKVVDEQGRPITGAKVGLYKLTVDMEILSFDVELAQTITTRDDGSFTFETVAEQSDARNQMIILADKEGLALGWANWYLWKDLDVVITLGGPEVLAGRVVDESGQPVSDAEVSLSVMLMTCGGEPRYVAGKVSKQLFSRKTDADGRFRFERIAADAAAEFIVKKPGLATVGTLDESSVEGMHLQFKAGQEDIEIKLPAEAKIEGMVVESQTGKPVPGIKVLAFQGERQPFSGQEPVTSREDGTFTIGALCPGKQVVRAVLQGQVAADWVAQPVEVTVQAGRTVSGVKVELSSGGVMELSITELDDNRPISGATVNIQNTVSKQQFALVADTEGMIRKRLAPGEYQVTHVFKQDYPYEQREEMFTIEDGKICRVEVQLKGYPKVTGTIRDENGRPVAGARIKVCPLGRGEATSDAEGRYEVRRETEVWAPGLVPFVVARHFERNLAGAVEFADDTKVVDVTMTTGVTCVGKVVDVDGKPIENAQVYLTFWSSGSGSSMARQKNTTNAEGYYEIKAVPRHPRYSVNASAEGYGEDYVSISTEVANGRFEVEPISLARANLSISGIVVDMDGRPVDNAQVYCQGRGQPYRNTQTDPNGRFTLENLCAGKITIYGDKRTATQVHGRTDTEGGATGVRIVISQRQSSTRYEPKKAPSLMGKPLPDPKALGVDLPPRDTDGKMILVCFWDMNQRPSRNCITQLAKQVEPLKEKGVVVIAVQASKVDESEFDKWVKTNNIPFLVGMMQDDEEKTRFAWGVQSLPWLILTDREHVVVAEGLGLNELDEKIKNTTASPENGVQRISITGLVKDPQGQALSNVRVTEFQTDKEYVTDANGGFVSAYGVSDNTRYFFAVHRQRELVGVGQLAARQRHVEINLVSAKMVSGTVVDPHGKPVVGAEVAALPMTCFYVLTDGEGKFDVGWNPEWARDLKEFFLMARHLERNLAGGVEFNQDTKTVRTQLEPALTLAGTVEDPNGVPIPEAKVGLSLRRGWACGTPVKSTITDKQGRYEFRVLPQQQEYINYAEAGGYFEGAITTGIINRITDREKVGPIILKKANLSVSGVVIDDTGKPVANCPVGLRGAGQPQRQTKTDAQGRFTLDGICSGDIEIWAKLDNVLYGTLQARAGQKNVRLVVSPMRKPDSGQIKGTCEGFSRV